MNIVIDTLLHENEKIWLEYKSYWYWCEGESQQRGWGEFLKDFVALFNTYSESMDKKYFVIGYDEVTKKRQNYNIDNNGNKLKIFDDLNKFKYSIVDKLRNHFKNLPLYKNSEDLINIETLFEIQEIVDEDNIKILIIIFKEAPFLLELKKILQGNETFRTGNVITRIEKMDGSPENTNADSNMVKELLRVVENIKLENFPEKEISIKKIVEIFKERNFPSGSIEHIENKDNLSSGVYYEIYRISNDYSSSIEFIYFSKHTVQHKTLENLVNNKILDKNNQKIIIVDELNKKGGKIDKKGIFKQFEKEFNSVKIEVFYIEEFAIERLFKNLFNSDIFHEGNFGIKDFIKPYTDISDEKTADFLLKEWYSSHNEPLLVMKGMGGIGKTTVIKYFLDELYKTLNRQNKLNILFINSHEIIDDIMKNSKIDNLFDFYRIIADKNDIQDRFDKKLLELSIDSGNMIIVLDGLDEVIAKMGTKFNISNFINSIFEDYTENLEKTKIIITCRDYFWEKNQFQPIKTMSLKPFDKVMADKYFKNFFGSDDNKYKNALKLANEFALKEDENEKIFIPYVLDMIKEDLLLDEINSKLSTKILLPNKITNDFIISKACEREIIKLGNLSIDDQVRLFIHIAVKYNGVLHEEHFPRIKSEFQQNSDSFIEKFAAHPLLEFKNKILKFRYDFFNEFFKNIKIVNYIKDNNLKSIDRDLAEIIIQHISYDGSLSKDIKKRLENTIVYNELKLEIYEFIEEINSNQSMDFLNDYMKKQLISSFFILLLILGKHNNIDDRTSIMKELFCNSEEVISDLCLINLHTTESFKPIFNFNNLKFNNCYFENYEYFTECKFNEKTFFKNTTFIAPLHRENINSNLNWNNIEITTCAIEGIVKFLQEKQQRLEEQDTDLRKDLKHIIKFFWSGSTFKSKTEEETLKKLRTYNQLLSKLLKQKVIIKTNITTKQKRNDYRYKIDPSFSNLRKIMEENDSCVEFEEIIKIIS